MFTGIIKEMGVVRSINRDGHLTTIGVESGEIVKDVKTGDSISVNGVCLTVTGIRGKVISFDVMKETSLRTGIAELRTGDRVNLEDSLKSNGKLGGHFVLGHVDCPGKISRIDKRQGDFLIEIVIPEEHVNLVVEKGSVAVDGVSLTVGKAGHDRFEIYLIPHTLEITTLGFRKVKDTVNIEFDIIGKYLARFFNGGRKGTLTEEILKDNGFI